LLTAARTWTPEKTADHPGLMLIHPDLNRFMLAKDGDME
jgi:hypothetical protein